MNGRLYLGWVEPEGDPIYELNYNQIMETMDTTAMATITVIKICCRATLQVMDLQLQLVIDYMTSMEIMCK